MVTSSSRDSLYRHFDKLTKEEQVELICTWAHVSARVAHAHVCACMHVLSKHRCNIAPTSSCCTCMHKCTHSHAGSLRRRDKHRGGCRPSARGQTGAQRKCYELVDTYMHTSFAVHLHLNASARPRAMIRVRVQVAVLKDALGRKDRLEKLESMSEKFDDSALKGLPAQVLKYPCTRT